MSKVIVFAIPVFLLCMALDFALGRWRAARGTGHDNYRINDALNSLSTGLLSQLAGVLTKALMVATYTLVFNAFAIYPDLAFWNTWYGYVTALVFYDLCYYWAHRGGHEVAVLWASHVVHHQSQHYNLSTALRQSSSGALLIWIFYIPMALAGVPPLVYGIVSLVDLLYQFWVHTEQVGKLGWFDRVFCSPSNHRVHHAVNDKYIDRNYGGVLVVWDRLFGSFQQEEEKCVYGTRGTLNSWDPVWANAEVYWALAKDSWRTEHWFDKLLVWFKPPGWQSTDLTTKYPKAPFTLDSIVPYDPVLTPSQQWFASFQFMFSVAALGLFLWNAEAMPLGDIAIWAAAISVCIWAQGRYLQNSLAALEVLLIESAALATLASINFIPLIMLFKPLPMVLAIAFVLLRVRASVLTKFDALLLGGLFFSLCGDVFLMIPGNYFIPGLASFLVAHLFYIVVFRQRCGWFPSKAALGTLLAFGATIYAVLWSGLTDPVLKVAVGAYVTVISLMVAQVIGRATVVQTATSCWVAVGACIFMVSDILIAIDKFLTPVPLASFWILVTYFAGQALIVHNARPTAQG